jgi:hypothetical protein
MQYITDYVNIFSAVLGFIAGCGVTFTLQKVRQGRGASLTDQPNATAGRDQAGRDIIKKS